MRPDRFQAFALDLVKNTPNVTRVQTLAEAGDTKHPGGLAITTAAGVARWQILGQLGTGEKHSDRDTAVKGDPPQAGPAPADGDSPEAWLAAVLAHAQCPEIATISRWSTQGDKKHGMTVTFHNSARIFLRLL